MRLIFDTPCSVSLCALVFALLYSVLADAQDRTLIDAARKEGRMVFYTSVETEFARALTS